MKANFVVLITLVLVSLVYTDNQDNKTEYCEEIEDPSAYSHCEKGSNTTYKCCYLPEKYECKAYTQDESRNETFISEQEAQCGSDYLKMFALALFAVLF